MKVSRRAFLASSATVAASGALVIGFRLHRPWHTAPKIAVGSDPFDAWIHVQPDGKTILRQQIEGAIIFALSAVLKGEITIANGQVQQTNFNGYDLVRMPESPRIEVYLVENHLEPSGIGEAGVPYVGPAVANAIFAASGKRLRKSPLRMNEGLG